MGAQESILNLIRMLNRVSLLVALAYCGWLAYDYYYDFQQNPESPKNQKLAQIEVAKKQNETLRKRIREINEFFKNLEVKKQELRALAQELDGMKASLSESIDVPAFMNLITTEARKLGLTVARIRPAESHRRDYYGEQDFELNFRGVYVQLLVFLNRLAQSTKIMRVETYQMRPRNSSRARFVELEGTIQIKAYYYVGSKEDKMGRGEGSG